MLEGPDEQDTRVNIVHMQGCGFLVRRSKGAGPGNVPFIVREGIRYLLAHHRTHSLDDSQSSS